MEYLKRSKKKKKRLSLKNYKIIKDFSIVTEKDCIDADKYNIKIYRNALTDIDNAMKLIESNGLTANLCVPAPPEPNNHKKYLLWVKRSIHKPSILQSQATLYLHSKGFVLNRDYEPYQAIKFANENRLLDNLEPFDEEYLINEKNNFTNVYTNKDKNILRRKKLFNNSLETFSINNYDDYNQPREYNYSKSQSYPPSDISLQPMPDSILYSQFTNNSYNNIYPVVPSAPPVYNETAVNELSSNEYLENNKTKHTKSISTNTEPIKSNNPEPIKSNNPENVKKNSNIEYVDFYGFQHLDHVSQVDDIHSVSNLVLNPHVKDRVNEINELNEYNML